MYTNIVDRGTPTTHNGRQKVRNIMAKASIQIVCADCGETFKHEKICYNRDAATNYEEWVRDNITQCPKCYKVMMHQIEAAKEEKAIEGIILSDLTGTEKQIAWATDIRRKAAAMCAEYKPNEKFWAAVNQQTSAKWWIDNRDSFYSIRSIYKALQNA